jgi:nitroreductase
VELDDIAALIRRPVLRAFDPDRTVSDEVVRRLLEAARWTGSARNRQPWRFATVRDRSTLRRLSGLGAYAQFVADAPVVLVLSSVHNEYADSEFDVGRITQSIVISAAGLGLGSCPATLFPEENVDAARSIVDLPADWRPRHLLALGYPPTIQMEATGVPAVPRGRREVVDLVPEHSPGL